MSEIIIPERLAIRLSHDKTWDSCVIKLKENIEPLLAKDPDFFPDYTIHGIDHINRCLDIADHLIDFDTLSEEPKKTDLLTPRDVAFLVCGILLHDMGMFLRPDGVRKLVQMDHTDDAFGGKPWKDEWSDYVDRTKRLSQEKMRYHFGKVIPVAVDCVNHTDTDDNKRIIGEFLRQHHARLAHELATDVLNGIDDMNLFENTSLKEKDRKLIGILARSHGMAIRDTESYVEKHIGKGAKPYNTPIFYLMTVLRTADALDADERRAPEKLERQKKPHVPISVEEWTWNQCIDHNACDWRMEHKNRYIEAAPESSPQYVQLDKWLKRVQADLDLCWSILAEKYPYDRYRLSIHRVVSNIHEPGIRETMNEKFLTKEAKITANPEIVKLMMEPLYGDDPTYGVRELLQNAVDACVERKKWEEDHGNLDYKGLVDIRIENGIFTITDNGMGMNEDVLLNYYLSAGSSYRSSEAWMAANAPDGESRVARTGKFGVGFLATFLLGNEVEVLTKHRADNKGYHFTFNQDCKPLDIKRADRINPYAAEANDPTHAGTTITIRLKDGAYRALQLEESWHNWYSFDDPEVRYFLDGTELFYDGLRLKRDPKENASWISAPSGRFASLQWLPRAINDKPSFFCNGIRIEDVRYPDYDFYLELPINSVSVIDPDAVLDVNVSRSKVRNFPEFRNILHKRYWYVIAHLLLTEWDSPQSLHSNLTYGFGKLNLPTRETYSYLLSPSGFTLNHASVIAAMGVRKYLALLYAASDPSDVIEKAYRFTPSNVPVAIVHAAKGIRSDDYTPVSFKQADRPFETFREVFWGGGYGSVYETGYPHLKHREKAWIQGPDASTIAHYFSLVALTSSPPSSDGVYTWENDRDLRRCKDRIMIDEAAFSTTEFPVAIEILIDKDADLFGKYLNPAANGTYFSAALAELLTPAPDYPDQDLWIPFDMEERKKKYPRAFEELKSCMDYIRKHPYG